MTDDLLLKAIVALERAPHPNLCEVYLEDGCTCGLEDVLAHLYPIVGATEEGRIESGHPLQRARSGMDKGSFHWRDGWHFRRIEQGNVEVTHHENHNGRQVVVERLTIPAAEWCSIIAAVSEPGGSEMYAAAIAVHAGEASL